MKRDHRGLACSQVIAFSPVGKTPSVRGFPPDAASSRYACRSLSLIFSFQTVDIDETRFARQL
jgi:hypothetical protein